MKINIIVITMVIIILCIYSFLYFSYFVPVKNCFLFSLTAKLLSSTRQVTSLKVGGKWKRNIAQRITSHPACLCRAYPGSRPPGSSRHSLDWWGWKVGFHFPFSAVSKPPLLSLHFLDQPLLKMTDSGSLKPCRGADESSSLHKRPVK